MWVIFSSSESFLGKKLVTPLLSHLARPRQRGWEGQTDALVSQWEGTCLLGQREVSREPGGGGQILRVTSCRCLAVLVEQESIPGTPAC